MVISPTCRPSGCATPFDPACLAHLVAAGVYGAIIGEPFEADLAADFLQLQAGWHDIPTIEGLARRVDQTPGVSFRPAITLATTAETAQGVLDEILRVTVAQRRAQIEACAASRVYWDPYIAAVVRARHGDHQMDRLVRQLLQFHAGGSWQGLAQALTLILDDQEHRARDAAVYAGDEALVVRCLNALHGAVTIPPDLAEAALISGLLSLTLQAARQRGAPPHELREGLDQIERSGEWDGLVPLLRALIAGDRELRIGASATAPVRAVVDLLFNADPGGSR